MNRTFKDMSNYILTGEDRYFYVKSNFELMANMIKNPNFLPPLGSSPGCELSGSNRF